MIARFQKIFFFIVVFVFFQLLNGWSQNIPPTLFSLRAPSFTGVDFNNTILESDTLNILNQANIYNGGGIGIGDFNKDGMVDMYFAGNMVSNKLYLNNGAFQFKDITLVAGVGGEGRWCTGVSVIDINADGWPDIYVSASFRKDALRRTNLLYINQGNNTSGVPVFKEEAARYGIADTGFSTQGYFFDYDQDGDLDLYLVTNELNDPKTPIRFRPKVTDGTALNTDRLYRNNGDKTFTDVSHGAGILLEGWGHAACISDFNMDGWPDVYVANDFISNDLLYINNKDGTFTNRVGEYFKHTGWNAMGTDAVDINNDGLVDIVSLEMLPEDNMRKKRMLSGNEYYNYTNAAKFSYEHQYVRNVLQLNSGTNPNGHPIFSDVGFMAGMYQTDWSWCPLVADFDNDGFRDLVITNGLPRDVTDLDYIAYDNGQVASAGNFSLALVDSLPVVKLADYSFKNIGGLLFNNTSKDWGFTQAAFSNGGVYADLDNDGDLDIVINNINDTAFIYENTAGSKNEHQLTVTVSGKEANTQGIGASIRIYYDGNKQQYYEHQPCRGYLSTNDARAHFGLGKIAVVDSMVVRWPDNSRQLFSNINAGQTITVSWKDTVKNNSITVERTTVPKLLSKYDDIHYKPVEDDFVDYNIQPTLPHKLSQFGPAIAVADIDNNGFEDFFIGGSSSNQGVFFMQDANGNFTKDANRFLQSEDVLAEDMGVLFFDADNDKDPDMYIVTGSYELPPNHEICQDRLYMNNGKGKFQRANNSLPKETTNGSCVRAADFDGDGDLDLFIGGGVVSGAYPMAPQSFILKNEDGKFTDVTLQYCSTLQKMGMITDALWSDFDKDGKIDLILTGEWMVVTFLKNTGKAFIPIDTTAGLNAHTGWWNSLTSGDFDNDGDIDYVAGNLGLNSNYKATPNEPMTIFAKDLDQNGSIDAVVFCYMKAEDGSMKSFPMHTKDDMVSQLISIRKKYPTYKSYGLATMDDLFSKTDRENALMLQATDMQTSYIENKGNGRFAIRALPVEAQVAPIFGMLGDDLDGDGNLDLLLVGNDYGMEPYSGHHDAFNGLCLKGDGKGGFKSLTAAESGFFVTGDAKGLAQVYSAKNEELIIATQNQDSLVVYAKKQAGGKKTEKWVNLKPDDFCADILYQHNKKRRMEFYYGSGYLSQSPRKFKWENDMLKNYHYKF